MKIPPGRDDAISRREFGRQMSTAALAGTLASALGADPMNALHAESAASSHASAAELVFLPASELAALIRSKKVSAREVMQAHLAQIDRVNPGVNAIVTLVADRSMAEAAKVDEALAHGRSLGPLHGPPVT